MKRLSLIQRFSIIALLAMIVVGLAFGHLVTNILKNDMFKHSVHEAKDMVYKNVISIFEPADLQTPKIGEDYVEFSKKIKHLSLGSYIQKIKIWNKNLVVIWFNEKEQIGKHFPDNDELKRAFNGEVIWSTKNLKEIKNKYQYDTDFEHLLELYIPIRFGHQGGVENVFEIYQNIDSFHMAMLKHERTIWLWTFIGFSSAYLVLFGIVWNASKRLDIQTKEITQSKQDWEDTFDTITDMITVHDRDYNILRANKAAEKMLKLPELEINKTTKCFKYYHGTDRPPEGCPSCDCLKTGKFATFELFEPHLNMFIEIRAIPRFDNNKLVGLIHVVRDITERKHNERMIQLQINRLNSLRSIDRAITSSLDIGATLDIFLEQISTQLNIDAAAVLLLNQHTQILEYVVSRGFRTSALKYTRLRLGESNAGHAAIERKIVTILDLKEEADGFIRSELFAAEDFITYFAVPLIAKGEVKGVLELFHRSPLNVEPDWLEFLETIANQGAIAIDNAVLFDGLQRSNIKLMLAYDNTIEGWSHAMDLRDKETEGHSRRVSEITLLIAKELDIDDEKLVHIKRGALLHDIGKMGIPDNILLKAGPLTEKEWEIMKRHPEYAYEMLYQIEYLRPAIDIPLCHHEKWDGTGYPRGLKGKEIPLSARIFAVVDVWDALCSDRPYRAAWPEEKVLEHIRTLAGTHFDPEIVEVFLKIVNSDSRIFKRDIQGVASPH